MNMDEYYGRVQTDETQEGAAEALEGEHGASEGDRDTLAVGGLCHLASEEQVEAVQTGQQPHPEEDGSREDVVQLVCHCSKMLQ